MSSPRVPPRENRISISVSDSDNADGAVSGSESPPRSSGSLSNRLQDATSNQLPRLRQRPVQEDTDSELSRIDQNAVARALSGQNSITAVTSFKGSDEEFSAMRQRIADIMKAVPTRMGKEVHIPYNFEPSCDAIRASFKKFSRDFFLSPFSAESAALQMRLQLLDLAGDVEASSHYEGLIDEEDLASRPELVKRINSEMALLAVAAKHLREENKSIAQEKKSTFVPPPTSPRKSSGSTASIGDQPADRRVQRKASLGRSLSEAVKSISPRSKLSPRPDSTRAEISSTVSIVSSASTASMTGTSSNNTSTSSKQQTTSVSEDSLSQSSQQESMSQPGSASTSRDSGHTPASPNSARTKKSRSRLPNLGIVLSPTFGSKHSGPISPPLRSSTTSRRQRVDFSHAREIPSPNVSITSPGTSPAPASAQMNSSTLRPGAQTSVASPRSPRRNADSGTSDVGETEVVDRRMERAGAHRRLAPTPPRSPAAGTKRSGSDTPDSARPGKAARHNYQQSPGSTVAQPSPQPNASARPPAPAGMAAHVTVADMARQLSEQLSAAAHQETAQPSEKPGSAK